MSKNKPKKLPYEENPHARYWLYMYLWLDRKIKHGCVDGTELMVCNECENHLPSVPSDLPDAEDIPD